MMQKFSLGNDTVPYVIKLDESVSFDQNSNDVVFKIDWLDAESTDKKDVELKIDRLNSIFKKSHDEWFGVLHPYPSYYSRSYLSFTGQQMDGVFSILNELGINDQMIMIMLKNLFSSKFRLNNAVEALLESNYNAWQKIQQSENELRDTKTELDKLKNQVETLQMGFDKLLRDHQS